MKKQKPTGFIAICQCGEVVGAMDYIRTERKDAGKIIGKWLAKGCTVQPKFVGIWSVTVTACKCKDAPQISPHAAPVARNFNKTLALTGG